MNLQAEIKALRAQAFKDLAKAESCGEESRIEALTARWQQVVELAERCDEVAAGLAHFRATWTDSVVDQPFRIVNARVTASMRRNHLLTVTEAIKAGVLQIGENLRISSSPGGAPFDTSVLAPGNRLRARGEIGRFYQEQGVEAGNTVVLTETAPGCWTLKKEQAPSPKRSRENTVVGEV